MDDQCWPWPGRRDGGGYGIIYRDGRNHRAHRLIYESAKGKVPEGLVLDHLCRNPPCVNPAHLEPVTNRENTLRGIGPTAIHARATHCPSGHPYTPENVARWRKAEPDSRQCRECNREKMRTRAAARAVLGVSKSQWERLTRPEREAALAAVRRAA